MHGRVHACEVRGTSLGSTTTEALFPIQKVENYRPCICAESECQGKSGVWKGCSELSAQVTIWTDGLVTSFSSLLILSRSLRIQGQGQATLALLQAMQGLVLGKTLLFPDTFKRLI
eukprot:1066528-Pelagomonas_calceolata.AAC.1